MPNWRDEFPGMPKSDMPAIPSEWVDSSWRNEACPSFTFMSGARETGDFNFTRARVWIDFKNPDRRDPPNSPRFTVTFEDDHGRVETVFTADDWPEILAYVGIRVALSRDHRALVGPCPFLDDPHASTYSVFQTIKEGTQ